MGNPQGPERKNMDEMENSQTEVQPQEATQSEQVDTTAEVSNSPEVSSVKEELILGKFKSAEDLAKSYQELERKFTLERMARNQVQEEQVPTGYPPELDETSAAAVDSIVQRRLQEREIQAEQRKIDKFIARHGDELNDPFLASRISSIISEANRQGKYVEHEEAFKQAKSELETRLKPRIDEAKNEGVKEGNYIAQQKEQLGAVGQSGKRETIDPNKLSAAEYAKFYGLNRVE